MKDACFRKKVFFLSVVNSGRLLVDLAKNTVEAYFSDPKTSV